MRSLLNRALFAIVVLSSVLSIIVVFPVAAGDMILSNNSGVESAVFYIEGESSLVINGFDLTPLALELPVALDTVSISVNAPVPGSIIDLVVYQDANGGSPVDATLAYRQQVTLERSGINRIVLDQAAIITDPVVWVGFYLPVGFRFNADQSGSSVLTYWAWTPESAFDLASLGSAGLLGPGDGSEPVGIAMDGIARITAELRTPQYEETVAAVPLGRQLTADAGQDTSIMQLYEHCGLLLYDPEDISITAASSFSLDCQVAHEIEAPTVVAQPQGQELDLQRAGHLYKLSAAIPQELHVAGAVSTLPVRVTHCIRMAGEDLERAVIGEVRESTTAGERWFILPSVRFGDLVCAEVSVAHYIAYFLPRTEESPPNVNLVLGWSRVSPHPLECGVHTTIQVPVVNTGQSWFETGNGDVRLTVQNIHVRTGLIISQLDRQINTSALGPGVRHLQVIEKFFITEYIDELHRLEIRIDTANQIEETNEFDNTWTTEYILKRPAGPMKCADPYATPLQPEWIVQEDCSLLLETTSWSGSNRRLLKKFEQAVFDLWDRNILAIPADPFNVNKLSDELKDDFSPEDIARLSDIWGVSLTNISKQTIKAFDSHNRQCMLATPTPGAN